ncbi:MAG TPA: hypothetical protein VNH17_15065, partial [Streptosporangiaceae bacterium]|nr:hypothetical protein [Streptosporangiaceae bacterium]
RDLDDGAHASTTGRAEDVSVTLVSHGSWTRLYVSCQPYGLDQAPWLASLLARLNHPELAALITRTAALAEGGMS